MSGASLQPIAARSINGAVIIIGRPVCGVFGMSVSPESENSGQQVLQGTSQPDFAGQREGEKDGKQSAGCNEGIEHSDWAP
jgi:hypothetical protein